MDIRQLRDDDGEHAALHDLGGDGPALLLTHGNGLNAGMWATVVPHLRATFHCFGLDFRGHGASQQAHERIPVERHWFVAEVLAAVDAIGGAPALAAGHSLGGATLLRTEQQHPGTLRACWAFEPVLVPDTWDGKRAAVQPDRGVAAAPAGVRVGAGGRRPLPVEAAVRRLRAEAVRAYVERGHDAATRRHGQADVLGRDRGQHLRDERAARLRAVRRHRLPGRRGRRRRGGDRQRAAADGGARSSPRRSATAASRCSPA